MGMGVNNPPPDVHFLCIFFGAFFWHIYPLPPPPGRPTPRSTMEKIPNESLLSTRGDENVVHNAADSVLQSPSRSTLKIILPPELRCSESPVVIRSCLRVHSAHACANHRVSRI